MSRHNPVRLEVGRTYQLDGRKRRWELVRVVDLTGDDGADTGYVLESSGRPTEVLTELQALKRLTEVWQ